MDLKCSFSECGFKSEFSCSCDKTINLCGKHYICHIREPGIHREIIISEVTEKIINKARAALETLRADKIKYINTSAILVDNVTTSMNKFNQDVRKRGNYIKNLANSRSLEEDTERLIQNSAKTKYELNEDLKESASIFLQMFNDEDDKELKGVLSEKLEQNMEYLREINEKNSSKIKALFCFTSFLIVLLSILAGACYYISSDVYDKSDNLESSIMSVNNMNNEMKIELFEKISSFSSSMEARIVKLEEEAKRERKDKIIKLLELTERLESDFNDAAYKLDNYIQRFSAVADKTLLKSYSELSIQYRDMLKSINNDLNQTVNSAPSAEEIISIFTNTNSILQQITDTHTSCKSLLVMLGIIDGPGWNTINKNILRSIKITNDKTYLFYCN